MSAGIDRFLVNQHNGSIDTRWNNRSVGCPTPYALVLIAERFGQDPVTWPYQHDTADVLRLFAVLNVEGRMKDELARARGERYYLDDGA